jgi:hypothetical protein
MAICTITTENDADFIYSFKYQYVDASGTVIGPVDLTGDTMRMGIRKNAADVTQIMVLTTENGGLTITDALNGAFMVTILKSELEGLLQFDTYDHSLIRFHGTQTLRIWSGTLTNTAGPSR